MVEKTLNRRYFEKQMGSPDKGGHNKKERALLVTGVLVRSVRG